MSLAASAPGCASAGLVTSTSSQERIIEIDGKTHPEQIPDYLLWRHVFHYFDSHSPIPADAKPRLIRLSAEDYALLQQYADKQLAVEDPRQREEQDLLERIRLTGNAGEQRDLVERFRAVQLAGRQTTLDLADALLSEMTVDGRPVMLAWAARFRTSISTTVPESDLAFFGKPR